MIEQKFVAQKVKEFQIKEYIMSTIGKSGVSAVKLQPTPLGEKITVFSSHPGLVVGKGGENIKKMTRTLKSKFRLENPQIELSEIEKPELDAQIMADKIASYLERYGSKNFKGSMHRSLSDIMRAGAQGAEIVLSGKVPSTRSKTWRVLSGYMKKCGDIAVSQVRSAQSYAQLKSGIVGIKVKIMPLDVILPDTVEFIKGIEEVEEPEEKEEKKKDVKKEKKEVKENESKGD